MTREGRRLALVLLPWLSLPLVAATHLALWERLPAKVAVKFDWSGAASNWMSRGTFLSFEVGILLFVLAQYTFKLLRDPAGASRWVFVSYYAGVVIITTVFLFVLKSNL